MRFIRAEGWQNDVSILKRNSLNSHEQYYNTIRKIQFFTPASSTKQEDLNEDKKRVRIQRE